MLILPELIIQINGNKNICIPDNGYRSPSFYYWNWLVND